MSLICTSRPVPLRRAEAPGGDGVQPSAAQAALYLRVRHPVPAIGGRAHRDLSYGSGA